MIHVFESRPLERLEHIWMALHDNTLYYGLRGDARASPPARQGLGGVYSVFTVLVYVHRFDVHYG